MLSQLNPAPEHVQRPGQWAAWAAGAEGPVLVALDAIDPRMPVLWQERLALVSPSPHLAAPLAVLPAGEAAWLVSAWAAGESMATMASRAQLPVWTVVNAAEHALEGLAALHAAGLPHGAVTASRLVAAPDPVTMQTVVRLTGAGGSHATAAVPWDGPVTDEDAVTAPEIWRGGAPSPAADLYALGATLYFLLAGQHPHATPDMTRTACGQRHLDAVHAPLAEARAGVSRPLEVWLDWLMQPDPADRPPDAGTALRVLREVCQGNTANLKGFDRIKVTQMSFSQTTAAGPTGKPHAPEKKKRKFFVHGVDEPVAARAVSIIVMMGLFYAVTWAMRQHQKGGQPQTMMQGGEEDLAESLTELGNLAGGGDGDGEESAEDAAISATSDIERLIGLRRSRPAWAWFLTSLDEVRDRTGNPPTVAYCALLPGDFAGGWNDSRRAALLSLMRREERASGVQVVDFFFGDDRIDLLVRTTRSDPDERVFLERMAERTDPESHMALRARLEAARDRGGDDAVNAFMAPWRARMQDPRLFAWDLQRAVNVHARTAWQLKQPVFPRRPKIYALKPHDAEGLRRFAHAIDLQPAVHGFAANFDSWPWSGLGRAVAGDNHSAWRLADLATLPGTAPTPMTPRFSDYRRSAWLSAIRRYPVERWHDDPDTWTLSNAPAVLLLGGRVDPAGWIAAGARTPEPVAPPAAPAPVTIVPSAPRRPERR